MTSPGPAGGQGLNPRAVFDETKAALLAAGIEEAAHEAELVMRHVCGKSRLELDAVPPQQAQEIRALAARRAKREPLQYILGSWPFLDLELAVGPGVLIPRPETEEVCLYAAAQAQAAGWQSPIVLDLCSGTGALALGLKSRLPAAEVTAVELEAGAYNWLLKNAGAHSKGQNGQQALHIRPVQADALAYWRDCPAQSADLIISNPPYVREEEYALLEAELSYEPKTALVAEENGLLFYWCIARDYFEVLKPGGLLVFEIGMGQGGAVSGILKETGYHRVEICNDMAGRPRIAAGWKPQ